MDKEDEQDDLRQRAEAIVWEIATDDWWDRDYWPDGPLYCRFCNVAADDVRDGKADHDDTCIWKRSADIREQVLKSV